MAQAKLASINKVVISTFIFNENGASSPLIKIIDPDLPGFRFNGREV